MEVITIESQVYKEFTAKINLIVKFITNMQGNVDEQSDDGWVDSYEVCTFLKIGSKTLQRLRAANAITFSKIRGKNYYRISELERLMNNNIIHCTDEHFRDLINNYRLHVEQRRNIKANK